MSSMIRNTWQKWVGRFSRSNDQPISIPEHPQRAVAVDLDIGPDDPLVEYFINSPDAVEIDKIMIESDALNMLKDQGVKLVVPLVSQGELIGLLNLGPRLSEQDYSADDRRLLNTLSTQAAPALKVAQLAQRQQAEARERERMAQELRVARVIQQTLLPKELPAIESWQLAAHWQPARAVSGDFYDFFSFPDGRLGIVIGDVTDKGIPAAMVMATTRSVLRANAERYISPGIVLERSNEQLVPDIPRNMFVTCLYLVLEPTTGEIIYANAGHNLPYKNCPEGVCELRATGMPLGLMPGMDYEEKQDSIEPGESVLLYSDGLVEAHNPEGEMFGNPRLMEIIANQPGGEQSIGVLLTALSSFTGQDWEQEDDVTFVTLERSAILAPGTEFKNMENKLDPTIKVLREIAVPSEPGNERQVMEQVVEVAIENGFPHGRIEQLRTAVAEATMNAMEHGNQYDPNLPVNITVAATDDKFIVYIKDKGGDNPLPERVKPDIEAKITGDQSPRGWGLFLIENMVDRMSIHTDETQHVVQLDFNLKE